MLFAPKYLQDVHGWSPAEVALLNVAGGAFAIVGNPLAGWLGDRFGRRPVTALFVLVFGLAVVVFYTTGGIAVAPVWVLMIFGDMGSDTTLMTFGAEMFPTSQRSTASGVRSFATTVGIVVGLGAVSALYGWLGSNWTSIAVLASGALLTALLVALTFPETAGRTLEEIAPEPTSSTSSARR